MRSCILYMGYSECSDHFQISVSYKSLFFLKSHQNNEARSHVLIRIYADCPKIVEFFRAKR